MTPMLPSPPCRTGWSGSYWNPSSVWSYDNNTLEQVGCNVTVTTWIGGGSGFFQSRDRYVANGSEIYYADDPGLYAVMNLSADGQTARCVSPCSVIIWHREPPSPPPPPLPSCVDIGECLIQFGDRFEPPCCDDGVVVNAPIFTCNSVKGKLGYPESGKTCGTCLPMGDDCYNHKDRCCKGMSCLDYGISGWLCA